MKQDKNTEDYEIDVRVDPAVELFCVIHRLAGTHQYTTNAYSRYINDIEDSFREFENHRAIKLAVKQLRESNINGSAPMALAIYLGSPPDLSPRHILSPRPKDLDARWTELDISDFIDAAAIFSEETDFMDFYDSHQRLYDRSRKNLYKKIKNEDILQWFETYFAYQPEKFSIIIGMQTGYGNYGLSITNDNESKEYTAIIGASASCLRTVPSFNGYWVIPTIVHEFCHSYVNPLIDENYFELESAAEIIFRNEPPVNYFRPEIMLYEYLVRAITIRFYYSKNADRMIERRLRIDEGEGFSAIAGLVELLDEYESRRDIYASLSDFMPSVRDYFIAYSKSFK